MTAQRLAMAERRRNPLTNEWVVITAHRQRRTYRPPTAQCPLCPTSANSEGFTEVPFETYEVAVFENRFPALSPVGTIEPPSTAGLYHSDPAYGHCEVIVYSDKHEQTFSDLSPERIRLVIDVWIDRCMTLGSDPGVNYVMPFENKGELVGATLGHPHGQIYAFPDIPPRPRQQLSTAQQYFSSTRRCVQCDVCACEMESPVRVVIDTNSWLAYVPFAPQFPFEIHVVPKAHSPSLLELSGEDKRELTDVLSRVAKCYDRLWNFSLPYVMTIHQRPANDECEWDRFCHVRIEFKPIHREATKLKYLAGAELAAGAFIVDVLPEDAAAQLKRALP